MINSLVTFLFGTAYSAATVPGGTFDSRSQLDDWITQGGGSFAWVAEDADGSANSGSIELRVDVPNHIFAAESPCFPIVNGSFSYGGKIQIVQPSDLYTAEIDCWTFSEDQCTGEATLPPRLFAVGTGEWESMSQAEPYVDQFQIKSAYCVVKGRTFVPPPSAAPQDSTQLIVRFDDVFFSQTVTSVRLQNFGVE